MSDIQKLIEHAQKLKHLKRITIETDINSIVIEKSNEVIPLQPENKEGEDWQWNGKEWVNINDINYK